MLMKTSSPICHGLLLTGALALLNVGGSSAYAQTAAPATTTTTTTTQVTPTTTSTGPVKAIGVAPANSPQDQILKSALSSDTRETLQAAMNSAPAPATAKATPAPK
jgi:hypothetical protein